MAVFFTLTVTAICATPAGSKGDLSQPIRELALGGGFRFDGPSGPKVATTTVASLNLTSDPSGSPHFDEAMFIKAVRSGRVGARPLATVMGWSVLRNRRRHGSRKMNNPIVRAEF
jgi:hypothetical protein